MPHDRFFSDSSFHKNTPITLCDNEFVHLTQVMRANTGDIIELVNGKGTLCHAELIEIKKKSAQLKPIKITKSKPEAPLILAQALPRLNRLDTIVEKGTELGMTELWLFPGSLSEKKQLTEQQKKRLRNISIAAMKQCARDYLPQIKFFSSLFAIDPSEHSAFFGDLSDTAPSITSQRKAPLIFIGPEKGFSDEEISWLKEQGVQGVKLHHNVLRTDTAAIVGLTLLVDQ